MMLVSDEETRIGQLITDFTKLDPSAEGSVSVREFRATLGKHGGFDDRVMDALANRFSAPSRFADLPRTVDYVAFLAYLEDAADRKSRAMTDSSLNNKATLSWSPPKPLRATNPNVMPTTTAGAHLLVNSKGPSSSSSSFLDRALSSASKALLKSRTVAATSNDQTVSFQPQPQPQPQPQQSRRDDVFHDLVQSVANASSPSIHHYYNRHEQQHQQQQTRFVDPQPQFGTPPPPAQTTNRVASRVASGDDTDDVVALSPMTPATANTSVVKMSPPPPPQATAAASASSCTRSVGLSTMFNEIDHDKDGVVTPGNILSVFARLGVPCSQLELGFLVEGICGDDFETARLDRAQFSILVSRLKTDVMRALRNPATWSSSSPRRGDDAEGSMTPASAAPAPAAVVVVDDAAAPSPRDARQQAHLQRILSPHHQHPQRQQQKKLTPPHHPHQQHSQQQSHDVQQFNEDNHTKGFHGEDDVRNDVRQVLFSPGTPGVAESPCRHQPPSPEPRAVPAAAASSGSLKSARNKRQFGVVAADNQRVKSTTTTTTTTIPRTSTTKLLSLAKPNTAHASSRMPKGPTKRTVPTTCSFMRPTTSSALRSGSGADDLMMHTEPLHQQPQQHATSKHPHHITTDKPSSALQQQRSATSSSATTVPAVTRVTLSASPPNSNGGGGSGDRRPNAMLMRRSSSSARDDHHDEKQQHQQHQTQNNRNKRSGSRSQSRGDSDDGVSVRVSSMRSSSLSPQSPSSSQRRQLQQQEQLRHHDHHQFHLDQRLQHMPPVIGSLFRGKAHHIMSLCQVVDKHNKGYIDASKLSDILTTIAHAAPAEDVSRAVRLARRHPSSSSSSSNINSSTTSSGSVDYGDFVKLLLLASSNSAGRTRGCEDTNNNSHPRDSNSDQQQQQQQQQQQEQQSNQLASSWLLKSSAGVVGSPQRQSVSAQIITTTPSSKSCAGVVDAVVSSSSSSQRRRNVQQQDASETLRQMLRTELDRISGGNPQVLIDCLIAASKSSKEHRTREFWMVRCSELSEALSALYAMPSRKQTSVVGSSSSSPQRQQHIFATPPEWVVTRTKKIGQTPFGWAVSSSMVVSSSPKSKQQAVKRTHDWLLANPDVKADEWIDAGYLLETVYLE